MVRDRYGLEDLTVVVPVHNDRSQLETLLNCLKEFSELEVVVVDCKSGDNPEEVIGNRRLEVSPSLGRGPQIAFGIERTRRPWIWVVHADSVVVPSNVECLLDAMNECGWGRFNIRLSGTHLIFRVIEWFMNVRSSLSGICTGDQGIFVRRELIQRIGGFPSQELMEDIELCKQLKKLEKPLCLRSSILTSARKWESEGVLRVVVRMWIYRLRYFLGAKPKDLFSDYYRSRPDP